MNEFRALFIVGYVIFMIAFFGVMWTLFPHIMMTFGVVVVCTIVVAAVCEGIKEYFTNKG